MSYLRVPEYVMTNGSNLRVAFTPDGTVGTPKRGKKRGTKVTFVLQFLQETYREKPQDLHMTSTDRLCLHRFHMEHHAKDRNSRDVRQCAETHIEAGSIVDRLLNTKWMLPNSTIVLSIMVYYPLK